MCNNSKLFCTISDTALLSTQVDSNSTSYIENASFTVKVCFEIIIVWKTTWELGNASLNLMCIDLIWSIVLYYMGGCFSQRTSAWLRRRNGCYKLDVTKKFNFCCWVWGHFLFTFCSGAAQNQPWKPIYKNILAGVMTFDMELSASLIMFLSLFSY